MISIYRYNQLLIAALGTLALLAGMVIVVTLFFGPISLRPPSGLKVIDEAEDMPAQHVVFCTPKFLGQFQYLPVAVVSGESTSSRAALRSGGYSDRGLASCSLDRTWASERIFNVVIRDVASGQQKLLLDYPAQVASFRVPDSECSEGKGPAPCETIIWSIRRDTNDDGRIDARDLVRAHVSDLSGHPLRSVTPEDATLLSVYWSPRSEEILFRIRYDRNKDGRFSDEDGTEIVATSSGEPDMATAIVSEKLMKQLLETVQSINAQ